MSPCNDFITYFFVDKINIFTRLSLPIRQRQVYWNLQREFKSVNWIHGRFIFGDYSYNKYEFYTTISQRLCKQLSLYHLIDISYHFISMIILIPILKGESRIYGLGVRWV